MHVKRDDKVIVLTGKDKGKEGKVVSADPKNGKVIIEGINVAKRHFKPRKAGQEGGIIRKETPIYASKVMRVCPECDKPTRPAHSFRQDGSKTRVCKKCGKEI